MRHVHGPTVTSPLTGQLTGQLTGLLTRADRGARLSPYDPADAIFTTTRMLCADGAARGPRGLRRAIFAYNHACWYVRDVLAIAVGHTHRASSKRRYRQAAALCASHHHVRGYGRKHGARTKKSRPPRPVDRGDTEPLTTLADGAGR